MAKKQIEYTKQERIKALLGALDYELEELPEIVEEWDEVPSHWHMSWSIDWFNAFGRWKQLLEMRSEMSSADLEHLARLHNDLQGALPTLKQLGIYADSYARDLALFDAVAA